MIRMSSAVQDGVAQEGLWMHPGYGLVSMRRLGHLLSFADSAYHGNVNVYFDENLQATVMTLAFCGSGRGNYGFHNQVPHRLVEIADGVFRNYNKM